MTPTAGRSTSTSPDGAVTHYYYCPDACNPGVSLPASRNGQNYSTITVTNTRWSRDQYDGLGRVIRTDRGDTSGNVISNVDTNYDSCACSPTGKMVPDIAALQARRSRLLDHVTLTTGWAARSRSRRRIAPAIPTMPITAAPRW